MNLRQQCTQQIIPKRPLMIAGLIALLGLMWVISACDGNVFEGASDDDSYQARIEDAEIALDDGEFGKARSILEDLKEDYPDREEVCELLSNALAGLAGFDTFHYLETIDELEESGETGSIDMIGRVIGDENGNLTDEEVDTKLAYLDLAIYGDAENEGFIDCITDPDDSQTTQLGLLAVVHSALTIGDLTLLDLELPSLTLTEAGLESLYQTESADYSDVDSQYLSNAMQKLNTNLDFISDAVAVLDETDPDNDVNDAFSDFVNELDPDGDGLDENGNDVAAYINNL